MVQDRHVASRVNQVEYLGHLLLEAGVPIVVPVGGHAIFLDARRFLPHIPQEQYPSQALSAALYLESGVRGMERGIVSSGRDPVTGEERKPKLELVRLAIPRRGYTHTDMDFVAQSIIRLCEMRERVRGLKMIYETERLRFFQARFEPIGGELVG